MLSPTPIPSRSLHLSSQIHTLFISCLLENMCLKQENKKAKSKKKQTIKNETNKKKRKKAKKA